MQSKSIAAQADVPAKFLEAIPLELKRLDGFVDSKRGIFGGYFLAQEPEAHHGGLGHSRAGRHVITWLNVPSEHNAI